MLKCLPILLKLLTLAVLMAIAGARPAMAQFEVKGLGIQQGEVELEYQGDVHLGQPGRRFQQTSAGPPAEFLFDENEVNRQRHNFEISFGLTNYLEFGIGTELEEQRIDDPPSLANALAYDSLKVTSIQIEGTLVLFPIHKNGLGLGLYGQLEPAVQEGSPNHVSFGPVVTAAQGPWSVTLNPWLGHFQGGAEDPALRDERWSFEYAWQAAYQINEQISVAIEGYGIVNRLGDSGTPSAAALAFGDQDQHRAGPVIYYTFETGQGSTTKAVRDTDDGKIDTDTGDGEVSVSLGVLFGLNDSTSDTALKGALSLEY